MQVDRRRSRRSRGVAERGCRREDGREVGERRRRRSSSERRSAGVTTIAAPTDDQRERERRTGWLAPPVSATSRPRTATAIAPSTISSERLAGRSAAAGRGSRTRTAPAIPSTRGSRPACRAHRSVTATIVEAAKMKTQVATRMTRSSAAGTQSPDAVDRRPVAAALARPLAVGGRRGRRARLRRRSSSRHDRRRPISTRFAADAPDRASSVSTGTSAPAATAPRARPPSTGARIAYPICHFGAPAVTRGPARTGACRIGPHRSAAGYGLARPPLVALLHQAQVDEGLRLAHARGSCAASRSGTARSASLSSATHSTRMSYEPAVTTT